MWTRPRHQRRAEEGRQRRSRYVHEIAEAWLARASENLTQHLFRRAGAADQRPLGEIVAVLRRDQLFGGYRDSILRLHHIDVVGDAGGETVARLRQLLVREIPRLDRERELPCCRVEVEKRGAHLVVNRRLEIFGFRAAAADVGVRFEQAPPSASALEDRHVDRAADRKGRSGVGWGE